MLWHIHIRHISIFCPILSFQCFHSDQIMHIQFVFTKWGLCGCLRKVAPLFQFALCFTPYSLISFHSLIASFRPLEIAFNYSCLFSTNTLEMELANKQWQATLILVYSRDPLMHSGSVRLLTGTCYCLQLLCNSTVDTVNMFTGAQEPWPNTKVQR